MKGNTSCWNCSVVYPETFGHCPECGSTNANVDLNAAIAEMEQARRDTERVEQMFLDLEKNGGPR